MLYFDYAATTPLDAEVAAAMRQWLEADGPFANPASDHGPGRLAAAAVEAARADVAALIGAEREEIVWTSGATEADNLALIGAARWRRERGRGDRIVTLSTEHKAVLAACAVLEAEGFRVTRLPSAPDGRLEPDALAEALDGDTALVSIAHVNNETGVVQDLDAIAERVKSAGALLHVDAAQSAGRLALDVRRLPVDLISLSAHKCYGPKGVGALYVRRQPRVRLRPSLVGGGQEGGMRAGTVPVHQVVGMGSAFRVARERQSADWERLKQLRDRLHGGLAPLGGIILNGRFDGCPHIFNVSFAGVHGEALAAELAELAVSSGSACSSSNRSASHVLRAMGRPDALAHSAMRFSLGRPTTERDIDRAVDIVAAAVKRLRAFSPLWRDYCAGADLAELYGSDTRLFAA